MRDVLSLVSRQQRLKVIGGLFVSSIAELIGLTMIVPLLALASDLRQGGKTGLVTVIRGAFDWLGLPFDPSFLLILIVGLLVLKAAITIAVMRYVGEIVARINHDFQINLIKSLLRAEWRFYIRQPLGRLAHATGSEAAAVGGCFHDLATIFAGTLQILLFVTITFMISWPLALLVTIIGALIFLSFGKLVRQRRLEAKRHRAELRSMSAHFTDAMIGIKPLRAMGRTERFTRLFEADAAALSDAWQRRIISDEYVTELQEPMIGCLVAIGFYLAATQLHLAGHELLILSLLFVRVIATMLPMQRTIARFLQSYDAFRSLRALLKETDRAAEVTTGRLGVDLRREIAFDGVTFEYSPVKRVLDDVTLSIPVGRVTTIVGPSGVGKTTIADLIIGFYKPQAGRVLIDDTELADIDLNLWRRDIGYVPQEVTLFHASILNNISLWEEGINEADVENALKAAGAWGFVSELPGGLNYVVGERGNLLSGGQRQRISIARALLCKPKLLILDEATTGLDRQTELEICQSIIDLCHGTGLTVLAISHQPTWREVADRVYWINPGGTPVLSDAKGNVVAVAAG